MPDEHGGSTFAAEQLTSARQGARWWEATDVASNATECSSSATAAVGRGNLVFARQNGKDGKRLQHGAPLTERWLFVANQVTNG